MARISFEDKIIQEIKQLLANKEFIDDVETIQNKHGFPIKPYDMDNFDDIDKMLAHAENKDFFIAIDELVNKYKLPELADTYLIEYVRHNTFSKCPEYFNLVYLNPDIRHYSKRDDKRFTSIDIYPNTTINDIKRAWPMIQKKLKIINPQKRVRLRKNIDRDIEIHELIKEGKRSKEICRIINERYPLSPISYDYVSKINGRLKRDI